MLIAVASGKGGTGKTTVAVNLALSVEGQLQLLDCDVDEPNVHTLLPLSKRETKPVYTMVPRFVDSQCTQSKKCAEFCPNHAIFVSKQGITFFPELCYGCGGCILVCPNEAVKEDQRQLGVIHQGITGPGIELVYGELDVGEPLVTPVIKAVKTYIHREGKPTVIIDSPPGVSCPMVESVHGADFCLLVTEPTPFGLHDLKLAVETIRQLDIPMGVIVNRAGVGNHRIYDYCVKENLPILLEIPNSRKIAELFSEGIPFVTRMPEWKKRFQNVFEKIEEMI